MLESIVLGIYLWFKIYFLIDTNTKTWTEITDLVVFRKKLLNVPAGCLECREGEKRKILQQNTNIILGYVFVLVASRYS